jgi:hypothetical protein
MRRKPICGSTALAREPVSASLENAIRDPMGLNRVIAGTVKLLAMLLAVLTWALPPLMFRSCGLAISNRQRKTRPAVAQRQRP